MKIKLFLPVLFLTLVLCAFNSSSTDSGIIQQVTNCDSVPELNKRIVEFIKNNLRLKVGEGEAWDLAAEALNSVDAKWDKEYKFGRPVNYKTECVFPGDIIYLQNARIEYKQDRTLFTAKFPEHVAVVYEVSEPEDYIIAEQNTSKLGQKVGLTPLNLRGIKSGKIRIFRPESKQ